MANEPQQPTANDQPPTASQPKGFNWKVFLASGGGGVIIASIILLPLLGLGIYYFFQHGLPGLYGGAKVGYVYVPNEYFRDTNSTTVENMLSVMSSKFHLSTDYYRPYVQKIFQKAQEKQLNPGIIISVWGKEQGFKNPDKAFGYGSFNGSDSGFDNQLEGSANSMVKAVNNEDPYHYDDTNKPIFVRWIDRYTPLSDPRNSQDRMNFAKYLKSFIPNQIIEEQAPGGGDYLPGSGGWHWPLKIPLIVNQPRRNHYCFFDTSYADCADYGRSEGGAAHDPVFAIGNGQIKFQRYGHYPEDPYLYRTSPQNGRKKAGYNAWFYSSDGKIKAFYSHIYKAGISLNIDLSKSIPVNGGDQFAEVYAGGMLGPHLHFQFKYNGNWVKSIDQPSLIQSLINTNKN